MPPPPDQRQIGCRSTRDRIRWKLLQPIAEEYGRAVRACFPIRLKGEKRSFENAHRIWARKFVVLTFLLLKFNRDLPISIHIFFAGNIFLNYLLHFSEYSLFSLNLLRLKLYSFRSIESFLLVETSVDLVVHQQEKEN